MSDARKRFWRSGDPFVWTAGGAVAICLLMVFGLVLLVAVNGLGSFWPADVARVELKDGSAHIGEVVGRERIPTPGEPGAEARHRIQLKVGNRDVYGLDFRWIDEAEIASMTYPKEIVVLERTGWGNVYGTAVRLEGGPDGPIEGDALWPAFRHVHGRVAELRRETLPLELRAEMRGHDLVVMLADGAERRVAVSDIVAAYRPNAMGLLAKSLGYAANVWAFVSGEPRESNTEGGIFPAIFGTVMMALIMTVWVVPIGVLAAVYLKEYAGNGWIVSALRIAIRNLAGVPSIVFGVFGMGFFIYFVGGGIDRLFFAERLPTPTFGTGGILWASLTLALLTLPVVIVATEEGLASVPNSMREASFALGATQFETVWRVVVPGALPGILTGVILGIARATGEVAPLMMTGVVKLASELPVDGSWPFLHLERKFMHLGFFIYDLGFQSPNVEAARPMVFATALALLVVVFFLNAVGMVLRSRLRRRMQSSAV